MADPDPNLKPQTPPTPPAPTTTKGARELSENVKADGRKVTVYHPDGTSEPAKLVAVYRENPTIAAELECGETSFADVPAWNGQGPRPGIRVWLIPGK